MNTDEQARLRHEISEMNEQPVHQLGASAFQAQGD
jgi:hypothetical protein